MVATQRFGRRVMINFDFAASSNYLAPIFNPVTFASRGFRFRGLLKADLGGSYTLPLGSENRSVRFFGYVDNLFDREYFESGFRTPRHHRSRWCNVCVLDEKLFGVRRLDAAFVAQQIGRKS